MDMTEAEQPKRLTPTAPVTKELFLRSGNRCYYPGCNRPLMTSDGILVGEICHIEAPLPGGPRFRADMTNEERRALANLFLMCGGDHTIVDKDLETWTVDRLRELKRTHEDVYTGAIDRLRSTVGDITEGVTWQPARNLKRIVDMESLVQEDMEDNLSVVNGFAARLASVPLPARSVLALIVSRAEKVGNGWEEVTVPLPVLQQVADCSAQELNEHLAVLEHFELAYVDTSPYDSPILVNAGNSTPGIDWPLLAELKSAAGHDTALVRRVLIDLDFSAFDK